jgi:anaerobic selenocysteine-containing dehydrogenase
MDRKSFLQILGLSGAGVVSGCKTDSQRLLIPYLVPPKDIIPGIANWYASTCRECPAGCGILVRCREGRAVKVEGNSAHPINKGKLCARGQAILQELYNPDRLIEAQVSVGDGKFKSLPTDEAQKQISEKLNLSLTEKALELQCLHH